MSSHVRPHRTTRHVCWLTAAVWACGPTNVGDKDTDPIDTDALQVLETPELSFVDDAPTTLTDLVVEVANARDDLTYTFSWAASDTDRPEYVSDMVPSTATTKGERWTVTVVASSGTSESDAGQASVTILNTPPTLTLELAPTDPSTLDDLVTTAVVDDPDGDDVTLDYRWTVDGVSTTLTADIVPSTSTEKSQVWEVVVTPEDDEAEGEGVTASVTIGNTAPEVTGASISPESPTANTTLTATQTSVDLDGDRLTSTYTWYVDDVEVVGITGASLPSGNFVKGQVVRFDVVVDDGSASSATYASDNQVTIANSPPDFATVQVSPDTVDVTGTLTCSASGWFDPDGDPEGYVWSWFIGTDLIVDATDATLPGTSFQRGDFVSCAAAAFDGEDTSDTLRSIPVEVVNAPPRIGAVALLPPAPAEGETVTADLVDLVDPDGDPITNTYAWYVSDILRSTEPTLSPDLFNAGEPFYVLVTPDDGFTTGDTVRSGDGVAANTPPEVTTLTTEPEVPTTGDTIVVFVSLDDADGHTTSVSFRWTVDGQEVQNGPQSFLDSDFFERGQTVVVTATANDTFDDGPPRSSDPIVIANAPPSISSVTITPPSPSAVDTLTCAPNGWLDEDEDAEGYVFRWQVAGSVIEGADTAELSGQFGRGDAVRCFATPDDGIDQGAEAGSNTVFVINSAPTIEGAELSTSEPFTDTSLTVSPVGAEDPDDDALTFAYAWYVNEALAGTGAVLPASAHAQGDEIYVELTPTDGVASGNTVTSNIAVVQNRIPELLSAAISPSQPNSLDDLEVIWTAQDEDGDPLTPTFRWIVNGFELPTEITSTLPASVTRKGDLIQCEVILDDTYVTSTPLLTPEVFVGNAPPSITDVSIDPSDAGEETTIRCATSGWSDPDGDLESYDFRWLRNDTFISSNETIDGTLFDKGDEVYCVATPDDRGPNGTGAPVESAPIIIQNTAPTLSGVELDDTEPRATGSVGILTTGQDDVDAGDVLQVLVDWYVDDVFVTDTERLDGSYFIKGQELVAEVRVYDGEDVSAPVQSAPVTVVNSPPAVTGVTYLPNVPLAGEPLTVVPTSEDADGDTVTYDYSWRVGGFLVQDGPSDTLSDSLFSTGDVIVVAITPHDGEAPGPVFTASEVRIGNTPPSITSAYITPDAFYEESTITCEAEGWYDFDGDDEGYYWQWWVNGVNVAASQSIDGVRFAKDDDVYCVAIPFDGTSQGDPVASPTLTVLNTPPTYIEATLTRLEPEEGQTIGVSVIGVLDIDGDQVDQSYSWLVNDIAVADTAELTSEDFDKGDRIRVEVTLDDGTDQVLVVSNEVVAVNSAPQITSVLLTPGAPRSSEDIVAQTVVIDLDPADAGNVTVTYSWTVGLEGVPDITGDTLPAGNFTKNRDVYALAVASDGFETSTPRSSNVVRTINSPPTAEGAVLAPDPLYAGEIVSCEAFGANDIDGDSIVFDYQWLIDGVEVSTGPYLTEYDVGDEVTCLVRPFDGDDLGETITVGPYPVLNSPPVIGRLVVSNETPHEGDTIQATAVDLVDADNDIVQVRYAWYVNDVLISNTRLIDSNYFDRGDKLEAFATPYDDTGDGLTVSSGVFYAVNAPPSADLPVIGPANARALDDITATVSGDDGDGDPVTFSYSWMVNGSVVQSGASNVLPSSFHAKGDDVNVTVTPNDGFDDGPSRTTSAIRIQNTPPEGPSIAVTPATPIPGVTDLTCTITAPGYDPDVTDTFTYQFDWLVNGSAYGEFDGFDTYSVVDAQAVGTMQIWGCKARTWDGTAHSPWSYEYLPATLSFEPQSCADHQVYGAAQDGRYTLVDDAGAPYEAWCDQQTDGGGWTRVARTEGAERWLGQDGWPVVDTFAAVEDDEGIYPAFAHLRDVQQIMIVQTNGQQAGKHAIYQLYRPASGTSLLDALESCRDEVPFPGDDQAFDGPRFIGHTSAYSGQLTSGELEVWDPQQGALLSPDHVHVCGVHEAGANAASYLAFTHQTGEGPGWTTPWWGASQPGTLWSFASGPYASPGDDHIGTGSISGGAGWKGAGDANARWWHEGTYEIYVR